MSASISLQSILPDSRGVGYLARLQTETLSQRTSIEVLVPHSPDGVPIDVVERALKELHEFTSAIAASTARP